MIYFKINYKKVDTELEATTILKDIHNSDQIEIVEFFTGNSKNEDVLNAYFSVIRNN